MDFEQGHVCWDTQRKLHMDVRKQGQCSIQYIYAVYPNICIHKINNKTLYFLIYKFKKNRKTIERNIRKPVVSKVSPRVIYINLLGQVEIKNVSKNK